MPVAGVSAFVFPYVLGHRRLGDKQGHSACKNIVQLICRGSPLEQVMQDLRCIGWPRSTWKTALKWKQQQQQ